MDAKVRSLLVAFNLIFENEKMSSWLPEWYVVHNDEKPDETRLYRHQHKYLLRILKFKKFSSIEGVLENPFNEKDPKLPITFTFQKNPILPWVRVCYTIHEPKNDNGGKKWWLYGFGITPIILLGKLANLSPAYASPAPTSLGIAPSVISHITTVSNATKILASVLAVTIFAAGGIVVDATINDESIFEEFSGQTTGGSSLEPNSFSNDNTNGIESTLGDENGLSGKTTGDDSKTPTSEKTKSLQSEDPEILEEEILEEEILEQKSEEETINEEETIIGDPNTDDLNENNPNHNHPNHGGGGGRGQITIPEPSQEKEETESESDEKFAVAIPTPTPDGDSVIHGDSVTHGETSDLGPIPDQIIVKDATLPNDRYKKNYPPLFPSTGTSCDVPVHFSYNDQIVYVIQNFDPWTDPITKLEIIKPFISMLENGDSLFTLITPASKANLLNEDREEMNRLATARDEAIQEFGIGSTEYSLAEKAWKDSKKYREQYYKEQYAYESLFFPTKFLGVPNDGDSNRFGFSSQHIQWFKSWSKYIVTWDTPTYGISSFGYYYPLILVGEEKSPQNVRLSEWYSYWSVRNDGYTQQYLDILFEVMTELENKNKENYINIDSDVCLDHSKIGPGQYDIQVVDALLYVPTLEN